MKSVFITILLTALVLQRATASPAPIFDFGSIGDDIRKGIEDLISSGVNSAKDFAQNVQNGAESIIGRSEQYGQEVSGLIQQAAQNLTASVQSFITNLNGQIGNIRNNIKRDILKGIEKQLDQLNQHSAELQDSVGHVRNKWDEEISKEQVNILQSWNVWADNILINTNIAADGDNDKIIESERIINNYVNQHARDLDGCIDGIDSELDAFEIRTQSAIEDSRQLMQSLLQLVASCLESNNGAAAAKKCQQDSAPLRRKLNNAIEDIQRLSIEGANLLASRFTDRLCVIQTLAEFELGKIDVVRRIGEVLISQSSTTDSPSESTTVGA